MSRDTVQEEPGSNPGRALMMQVQVQTESDSVPAMIPRVDYLEKYIHTSFFGA